MADINEPVNNENIGGYNTLEFVERYNIETLPDVVDNVILEDNIVLKDGASWDKFYATQKTLIPNVPVPRITDAGEIWELSIKLRYPKESVSITSIFLSMMKRDFLIKLTNNNGIKTLYGNKVYAMAQKFGILTPGQVPGYSGYEVEFFGEFIIPPYYLQ